jgi:hypothetical protein
MGNLMDRHKSAALKRGQARTDAVETKVLKAMEIIKQEMAANGGIYPNNRGAVGISEVARRGGIHETTLYAPKQAQLKKKVEEWLDSLKERDAVGREKSRRKLIERVDDWRQSYNDLRDQHILVELELQDSQARLEELRAMYDALLEQTRNGSSNVTVLPTKSGGR